MTAEEREESEKKKNDWMKNKAFIKSKLNSSKWGGPALTSGAPPKKKDPGHSSEAPSYVDLDDDANWMDVDNQVQPSGQEWSTSSEEEEEEEQSKSKGKKISQKRKKVAKRYKDTGKKWSQSQRAKKLKREEEEARRDQELARYIEQTHDFARETGADEATTNAFLASLETGERRRKLERADLEEKKKERRGREGASSAERRGSRKSPSRSSRKSPSEGSPGERLNIATRRSKNFPSSEMMLN